VNKLTPEDRETLATLACGNSGIFESPSFHERMRIGSERIHSVLLGSEHPEKLRVLVVAPNSDHGWWGSPQYREHQAPAGTDLPVRILGSHKADPPEWNNHLLKEQGPGIWVISWESMRGCIPAKDRKPGKKATSKDVADAMRRGTIPPWPNTGTWDLVIAEDAHHMAFRSTLQRKVLKTIKARNRLALSDNTPGSQPDGLWGVLNWLWPDRYPNHWNWLKDCFELDFIKRARFTETKILGEKVPGCSWLDVPCAVRRSS
jgi:hypothetical protein